MVSIIIAFRPRKYTHLFFCFLLKHIKKCLLVFWRNDDFLFIFTQFQKRSGKGCAIWSRWSIALKNRKNKKLTHRIAIHKFSEKIHTISSFFDDKKTVLHSKNAWYFFILFLKNTKKRGGSKQYCFERNSPKNRYFYIFDKITTIFWKISNYSYNFG